MPSSSDVMNLRRSRVLRIAFAAMAGGLAARRGIATAQDLRPLKIVLFNGETAATAYYARDLGYFARAGLDVSITTVTNGAAGAAAVAGGAIDIGFSNPLSVAQGFSRGLPFEIIAPAAVSIRGQQTNGFVIVAKNSPLKSGKDAAGKTFAVDQIGGLPYAALRAWVDGTGGDSSSVRFIELAFAEMLAGVESGRVDFSEMNTAFDPLLGKPGDPVLLLGNSYDYVAPRFASTVWFSTKGWLANNPDLAKRFVSAMRQSAIWANAHQTESAPLLAKYTKQTVVAILASHRATFGTEITPELVQPVIDLAVKYGLIKTSFSASEMIGAV
jgi:ABC-type nitrate/sulfonate/bicarbonate transport system substrate-binding protein